MDAYLILKSIILAAAIIGAFGLFFIRVRRLAAIMKAVGGRAALEIGDVKSRLYVLLTDVLGQKNVRRKKGPGIAHMLIFFGFLAVQPHSLELMIQGVFPFFHAADYFPNLYRVYLFAADILAFLVLIGLAYALFRRVMIKPPYLTDGRDARLIILFTSVIIISFHFINAFHLLNPPEGFDYAGCFTVSVVWMHLFRLGTLTAFQQTFGLEIAYWVHLVTILGFLVYIPGSKHLHLLAAVPNVFLRSLAREKAMITTDIEDEAAESFGLGKISDLNWKNVLDLYACTECGRCEEQCPANATGKPLSPKAMVSDIKHDLFEQSCALLAGRVEEIKPIVREGSPVTGDILWSCTTCRSCEDICPVNIQHLDLILEARRYQVLMEAAFPPELQETFTNLENQSNPWGFSADTRADWCKELDVPLMIDRPEVEILWFVGCAGAFDERGKKIARAIARVLKKAGVDFAILGPEERCNGDMARRAGNEYLAQMMIRENVEILNRYQPKKILAGCPHCFNIIKNEYPGFGARYPVVHHSQYLMELMGRGRLKVASPLSETLAFHDSCYLGRWNGIFDEPRKLLKAINGGRDLRTARCTGDKGFCCGAGGARMFMEETMGKRINIERAEELISAGAKTVASACPFCATMLGDGIADCRGDAAVKDIAELVDEATG
jgi:Fe-S oxidoreductase